MSTPGTVRHGKYARIQAGATVYVECSQWTLRETTPVDRRSYFGATATTSAPGIPTFTGSVTCKLDRAIPPEQVFTQGVTLRLYESASASGGTEDDYWEMAVNWSDAEITASTETTNTYTASFENANDSIGKPRQA